MKKILLSVFAVAAFVSNSKAQDSGFSAGIHAGLPFGEAEEFFTINVGADVTYLWALDDFISMGLTSGYTFYAGKEFSETDNPLYSSSKFNGAFIPVAGTIKVMPMEPIFIGVDVGYGLYVGDGNGDGGFYYQTKLGYTAEKFDIFLSYKDVTMEDISISTFGIGGAYKFN